MNIPNWIKNIFKTKRILELDGKFYPQSGWLWEWEYLDRDDEFRWSDLKYKKFFECSTIDEAKQIIARHFPKVKKKQFKYHYV